MTTLKHKRYFPARGFVKRIDRSISIPAILTILDLFVSKLQLLQQFEKKQAGKGCGTAGRR
jgi:hypothetical protein